MSILDQIFSQARVQPKHIVLAEGTDQRVISASAAAARAGIARVTLLGDPAQIESELRRREGGSQVRIINPASSPDLQRYADCHAELRAHKGISAGQALEEMQDSLGYAAMMVRNGDADGTIAGAVATTADTIRAGLQIIGRAPGVSMVSSFFLMVPSGEACPIPGPVIFADCALVVEPGPEELADIALASAASARPMLGREPVIAMLSFSTSGSPGHRRARLVDDAAKIAARRQPGLKIDGGLQFDAAIDPDIRRRKVPDCRIDEPPNVFVFPNLDAANIGYKIAERIGGMTAIGPVLQGMARPANDLSRGCSAEDILNLIAITSVQASNS